MSTYDLDLNPVLEGAVNDELQMLAKQMEERWTTFLESYDEYKIAKKAGNYTRVRGILAAELREFGGNTIANTVRKFTKGQYQGPPYKKIIYDVAKKLKVSPKKDMSCEHMEQLILNKIIEKAWDDFTMEEKEEFLQSVGGTGGPTYSAFAAAMHSAIRNSGFLPYKLTAIMVNAISKQVLGHGLRVTGKTLTNAAVMKALAGTLARSVNIALWGWVVVDIASAAYRVTIPCVVIIALCRQRQLAESRVIFCSECGNECDKMDSYCPKCGTKLEAGSAGDKENGN